MPCFSSHLRVRIDKTWVEVETDTRRDLEEEPAPLERTPSLMTKTPAGGGSGAESAAVAEVRGADDDGAMEDEAELGRTVSETGLIFTGVAMGASSADTSAGSVESPAVKKRAAAAAAVEVGGGRNEAC